MKTNAIQPMLAVLLACATANCFAEQLACEFEKSLKGGASAGSSAKLTLADGKITALEAESFVASGQVGGVYECSLNSKDSHTKSTWFTAGAVTTLTAVTMDKTSTVTITKTGKAYSIDLSRADKVYCGFGSDWPKRITLEPGNKKCKVVER